MPFQRDPDAGGYVSDNDPYVAENDVLINLLGITNTRDLNEAEADFSYQRSYQLTISPIAGGFDLLHLQAIHRHLFQDVYPWAGEVRRVDIEKGDSRFAHYRNLTSQGGELLRVLADENHLQHLTEHEFSLRAGYYFGEINALHVFREGNGRAQREFMQELAHQATSACGLFCPEPVMMLHNKVRDMQAGDVLEVLATDPSTTRPFESA